MNTESPPQQTIDVNDSSEVAAWSGLLHVTDEQLKGAVAQVGNLAENVQPYLHRNEVVEAETKRRAKG